MLEALKKVIPNFSGPKRALHFATRGKQSLLPILLASADVFLQQEFNIKPLLGDIEGVRDAIKSHRERINKFLAGEAEIKVSNYNSHLKSYYRDSQEYSGGPGYYIVPTLEAGRPGRIDGFCQSWRQVKYAKAAFHAEMEYSYYLSEWQRQNAFLLSFLDRLGVMFDPAIVWNAIPYTFLIDWVIDVNRFLSSYRTSNMEPFVLVHRWLWSQHVVRTVTGTCKCNSSLIGVRAPKLTTCIMTEDAYIRGTDKLNVAAALTGSGINSKEFVLASALTSTRLGRR